MSYSNGILSSPSAKGQPGPPGVPGVGYKLTADGNFDIDTKRLTNLAESVDDNDAVSLKVLKEHTQVSQNNYHLQPSFKIYKDFGDKSQLTVGTPPNTPSNHFFNNHKNHHDPYIVDKEAGDTGFGGQAWSSMKLKGNQLESGSYTVIFEIFVLGSSGSFLVDDTIIYHVYGDSHYSITTFNSNKINGQYTRSMIQFTTDGVAGSDDGIKFQIKYFGSQYNNNIKFLFYSRVVKGKQSTSFDHAIFNVSDVQDNHTILYFENLNLNGNLINGLGNPVDNNDATNKTYVDSEIAKLPQPDTDVLKLDGSKAMTGNLNMGNKNITNTNKITTRAIDLSGPIDMFNNRIIGVRDGIYDKHAVNKQQLDAVKNLKADKTQLPNYLLRDGSNTMTGDLDINENHILSVKNLTDHKVDDAYSDIVKDLKSVVNKEYLNQNFLKIKGNYFDLNQKVIKNSAPHDDGSYDNNTLVSKAFVDAEIAKLPKPDIDVLKLDGSRAMQGNLMMNNNNIKNLKDPVNNQDAGTKKYIDDEINKIPTVYANTFYKKGEDILVSKQKKITFEIDPLNSLPLNTYVMNMNRYGIEKCGPIKMDDQGNSNLDMNDSSIINIGGIEMKNDNDSELDMNNNKIVNAGKLEMVNDNDSEINMNDNIIKNLGDPLAAKDACNKRYVDVVGSNYLKKDGTSLMGGNLKMQDNRIINLADPVNIKDAANKKYVDNSILLNNNNVVNKAIDSRIKQSEERQIESINKENVFKKVMDDDEFKEDDSDIHKVGVRNKNFHLVNKKTYEFNIDYDSSLGYYSTRLSIDLIYLPVGSYTMVYEMYIDNGITVDEIDSTSGTLTVGKINSKIDGTKTRSIINFTKYTISSGFDDLEIDIKLKGKTDPQTTINVVVYGVKGQVNNVSVNLWDRFYFYDNTSIKFELPVDMNQKDITGVNKITTNNLDVHSQIDMKGNKIIGVGDGTSNNDAVNKIQLDAKVATVNNKVNQMFKSLNNILNQLTYFIFTDQLIHKNHDTVIFPAGLSKTPFTFVRNNYDKLRISLSGKYLVSYTDSYKNACQFQIYDDTNSVYPFVIYLSDTRQFTEFSISTVINIQTNNGFGHSDIMLRVVKVNSKDPNPLLAGARKSTFYIKYLHA